jgi:hypothetical protein
MWIQARGKVPHFFHIGKWESRQDIKTVDFWKTALKSHLVQKAVYTLLSGLSALASGYSRHRSIPWWARRSTGMVRVVSWSSSATFCVVLVSWLCLPLAANEGWGPLLSNSAWVSRKLESNLGVQAFLAVWFISGHRMNFPVLLELEYSSFQEPGLIWTLDCELTEGRGCIVLCPYSSAWFIAHPQQMFISGGMELQYISAEIPVGPACALVSSRWQTQPSFTLEPEP